MRSWQSLLIREMTYEDLAEVERLARAADTGWDRRAFAEELARAVSFCRVLREREDGPIVAFIVHWVVASEQTLLMLATLPEARRRGWASILLLDMLDEGAKRGVTDVFLDVRVGNQPAIALYRKHGFESIDRRKAYYADGEDAWVMHRR